MTRREARGGGVVSQECKDLVLNARLDVSGAININVGNDFEAQTASSSAVANAGISFVAMGSGIMYYLAIIGVLVTNQFLVVV